MQNSRKTKTIFNSVFSTQTNEENSKKRLVELQESVDAAKKEKNQLIQESEEAKAQLRNEMDLLKQRMEQLVDEGADKQEKIDRLEAKRNELIAQVWSSYHQRVLIVFLIMRNYVTFSTDAKVWTFAAKFAQQMKTVDAKMLTFAEKSAQQIKQT
jgi:predicted nuclease with TOPRIM domain